MPGMVAPQVAFGPRRTSQKVTFTVSAADKGIGGWLLWVKEVSHGSDLKDPWGLRRLRGFLSTLRTAYTRFRMGHGIRGEGRRDIHGVSAFPFLFLLSLEARLKLNNSGRAAKLAGRKTLQDERYVQ